MLNYMLVNEAREKWGIGSRMVTLYCIDGWINGTKKSAICDYSPKMKKSLKMAGIKR
ncbi:MAG TPA: DNA-binding protein [Clostridiaceae bacterium]|jgi:hypothetical protein|nr:DNA-binding protein [Clostridiaceae bacterium]